MKKIDAGYLIEDLVKTQILRLSEKGDEFSRFRIDALNRFLDRYNSSDLNNKNGPSDIHSYLATIQRAVFGYNSAIFSPAKINQAAENYDNFSGIIEFTDVGVSKWLEEGLSETELSVELLQTVNAARPHKVSDLAEKMAELDGEDVLDLALGLRHNLVKITIAEKASIDKPILLRIISSDNSACFTTIVALEIMPSAQAGFVFEVQSKKTSNEGNLIPLILIANIQNQAKVDLFECQSLAVSQQYYPFELVEIGSQTAFNQLNLDDGGQIVNRYMAVDMNQSGGEAKITGIYLAKDDQQFYYDTHQNHHASHSRSNLMFKGVLEDQSAVLWKGNVLVAEKTRGVDGFQMNNNLLLSKFSRAESIPGLEILSDDVKCSHGVTLSNIDPDQLFYLQSRGIDPSNAIDLIKSGFISSAISRIDHAGIREFAMRKISMSMDEIYN